MPHVLFRRRFLKRCGRSLEPRLVSFISIDYKIYSFFITKPLWHAWINLSRESYYFSTIQYTPLVCVHFILFHSFKLSISHELFHSLLFKSLLIFSTIIEVFFIFWKNLKSMSSLGFFVREKTYKGFWKEKMRSSYLFDPKTKIDSNFYHYGSCPHRSTFVMSLNLILLRDTFYDTYGKATLFIWFVKWVLSKFGFWFKFSDDYEMEENEAFSLLPRRCRQRCCALRSMSWRTYYINDNNEPDMDDCHGWW